MSLYGAMKQEIWAELEARLPMMIAEAVRKELDQRAATQKRAVTTASGSRGKVQNTPPEPPAATEKADSDF